MFSPLGRLLGNQAAGVLDVPVEKEEGHVFQCHINPTKSGWNRKCNNMAHTDFQNKGSEICVLSQLLTASDKMNILLEVWCKWSLQLGDQLQSWEK